MTDLREKAVLFKSLHQSGSPLVLVNAWDVASARLVEEAGAAAIATTSAAVAWSLGVADGDLLGRERALSVVERVAGAVAVPVTADVENGFGADPRGLADTIRRVLAAGAVGVNIEDALYAQGRAVSLRAAEDQAERIRVVRQVAEEAGVPLFINARTDTYLRSFGDPADRLGETLERAALFVEAGADGIFVPGVSHAQTVAALADRIAAPLNVLAGPGSPGVGQLAGLGVARVSLGSSVAQAAYGLVRRAAREVLAQGTYSALADHAEYGELNALFGRR